MPPARGGGRNRIGRREKWSKQSWEEGEIGGKSREEGEKEKLNFREEGEIGSESREKGDLPPCSTPLQLDVLSVLEEWKLPQADQEVSEHDTNEWADHYWNAVLFLLKSIDGNSRYQCLPLVI